MKGIFFYENQIMKGDVKSITCADCLKEKSDPNFQLGNLLELLDEI